MCRRMWTMWPISDVMGWPPAVSPSPPTDTRPASPADVLIAHLGVVQRTSAEVQDLYSCPVPALVVTSVPVVMHVSKDSAPERLRPEMVPEPDLDAA